MLEDYRKIIDTVIGLFIEEGDFDISNLLKEYKVCRIETGTHIWKPNTDYYKLCIFVPKDKFDKIQLETPMLNSKIKDKIEDHLSRKEKEVFIGVEILQE